MVEKESLQDIKRQIDDAKTQQEKSSEVFEFNPNDDPQFKQSDGDLFSEPEQPVLEQTIQEQEAKKDEQDWKLMYGRSENEKGELRRKLEEAEIRAAQLERLSTQPTQPQQQEPMTFDFFQGMSDDEFYEPSKARAAWNKALTMIATAASQQIEAAKHRASLKDWDIDPTEEARIRQENADFINFMPPKAQDAFIYKQAKLSRMASEKPGIDAAKEQQAKLSQMTANRAFVESSQQASQSEPSSALDSLVERFNSGELNSEQMKAELKKYNLYNITDFRRR